MNLYIVESPFQLLQAIEYKSYTKDVDGEIIIRINSNEKNNLQMEFVCDLFCVGKVKKIDLKYKFKLLFYLIFWLKKILKSERVVFGDDNSFIFKICKKTIPLKKITLLDDGVATLNSKGNGEYDRFTIFEGVNGIRNEFKFCKGVLGDIKRKEEVNIIVGGKLVEEGICSEEVYHRTINKMLSVFSVNKRKVLYIPHRGESIENLIKIKNKFDVVLCENNLPIELIGYEAKVNPMIIASVVSTAMYSMKLLYDEAEFLLAPLKGEDLVNRKESIEKLYEKMKLDFNCLSY